MSVASIAVTLSVHTDRHTQQNTHSPHVPLAAGRVPVDPVVLCAHLPLWDCCILDPGGHAVHPPVLPGLQAHLDAAVVGDGRAAVRACRWQGLGIVGLGGTGCSGAVCVGGEGGGEGGGLFRGWEGCKGKGEEDVWEGQCVAKKVPTAAGVCCYVPAVPPCPACKKPPCWDTRQLTLAPPPTHTHDTQPAAAPTVWNLPTHPLPLKLSPPTPPSGISTHPHPPHHPPPHHPTPHTHHLGSPRSTHPTHPAPSRLAPSC